MSSVLTAVAWPYANGPRHIGHVSGFGVPSDIFSRYHRMVGDEVLMVSGTDEHGTPILVQADAEGVKPGALADRYNRVIVEDLAGLGLSYDLFTRTTTRNHYAVVQELVRTLHRNGYLLPRMSTGALSPSTGRTLPDRYVEGTCPICGYGEARGDQCDNCGNQLDAADLIDPRSRINGETPVFVESEHLFLDLPALAGALGSWLRTRTDWRPNVLQFSLNLLGDVRPRAVTRDIDWGVPVPLAGWSDRPDKKLYVWIDAVVGYLSASIEWAARFGKDPDQWQQWWTDPAARGYYFMGKDNITFHSQIWPAELLGYDGRGDRGGAPGRFGSLALPTEVVSSEFLSMSGAKFSTSRGVVIYVGDFLREFGPDALRYFIAVAGPETQDTDFTWDEFVRRTNSELANEWGNLVNRSISMAHRGFGRIPGPGTLLDADHALLAESAAAFDTVGALLSRSRFKAAAGEVMKVVAGANRYLSDTAPWKLPADPAGQDRKATILHTTLQVVDDLKALFTPFLPHSAQAVHTALGGDGVWAAQPEIREVDDDITTVAGDPVGVGVPEFGRSYPVLTGDYRGELARWHRTPLPVGRPLAKPSPLVAKLDPVLGRTGPSWAPLAEESVTQPVAGPGS